MMSLRADVPVDEKSMDIHISDHYFLTHQKTYQLKREIKTWKMEASIFC